MAGLFIAPLVEKCTACQRHWKSDIRWHRFQNRAYSLALAWGVRGLKSLKRFWPHLMALGSSISTGKPEKLLSLMCSVFFSGFLKSSVVYAAIVYVRDNDLTYNSIRFKKPLRHFLTANIKKTFQRIFSYDFGRKKKALSDFLASSSSGKIANSGKPV